MKPYNRLTTYFSEPPEDEMMLELTHPGGDMMCIPTVKGLIELGYSRAEADQMHWDKFCIAVQLGFKPRNEQ